MASYAWRLAGYSERLMMVSDACRRWWLIMTVNDVAMPANNAGQQRHQIPMLNDAGQ